MRKMELGKNMVIKREMNSSIMFLKNRKSGLQFENKLNFLLRLAF